MIIVSLTRWNKVEIVANERRGQMMAILIILFNLKAMFDFGAEKIEL